MAASKPNILTFHGTFYLPVVSLAMLAGFVVSFTLPVALSFVIPAMHSALFNLFPQLWNAFLSWITPPFLFFLLNSIIFVLTASSGLLSSSDSSYGSSDFCTNLLDKMEGPPKQSSGALMENFYAATPYTYMPAKMQNQGFQALSVDVPALATQRLHAGFDARGAHEAEEGEFYDAEDEEDDEEEEQDPCKFSKLTMASRSLSFSCTESRIDEEEEGDDGINYGHTWLSYGHSNRALVNKKISFLCKEDDDLVQTKSRSVPSSLHFATPPMPSSIKRSLSVDSASFHVKQASSAPSAESLSDEAFRKRVEDFISKMNAQLRKEVK
ncbi:hypothetical protein L7F22_059979 [Adiantum nelumboides]|nr:hypothetical protein [Adiantum nelumboides]